MRERSKKIFKAFLKVIGAALFGIFASSISIIVAGELIGFTGSNVEKFAILIGLFSFAVFLMYVFRPSENEGDDSTRAMFVGLKALSLQKMIAAVGALALGLAAAVVAGQAILDAASSSEKLTVSMPATMAYEKLLEQQSDMLSRMSQKLTDTGGNSLKLAIESIGTALERLEKSGRLEAESNNSRISQPIDGAFLFTFFSSLFVRVGTIIILLYLFSVTVKEYRRIDKRHLELQQILLSAKLHSDEIDVDIIKKARLVLRIDDSPNKTDTSEADTLFAKKFTKDVTLPLKEVSNAIRSFTEKQIQGK